MTRRSSSPIALAAHWPDGLTENAIDVLLREVGAESAPAPTSWLSMSDNERDEIRARRRHLRIVPVQAMGQARSLTVANGNEAA